MTLKVVIPKHNLFVPCEKFWTVKKLLAFIILFTLLSCNDDGNDFRDLLPEVPVNKQKFYALENQKFP